MEIIILVILIIGFALLFFKKKEKDNTPQELLVQLNNSLRQEIQEIRRAKDARHDTGIQFSNPYVIARVSYT